MNNFNWLWIVIAILVIFFIFNNKQQESFGLPLRSRFHVIVGKYGKPQSMSLNQPGGEGIDGCAIIPCPHGYADDLTCWCCGNYD